MGADLRSGRRDSVDGEDLSSGTRDSPRPSSSSTARQRPTSAPASRLQSMDSTLAAGRSRRRLLSKDAGRLSLAVLAALLFSALIRPTDAIWHQVAKYWDAGCGGPPYEVSYNNISNYTSCASLPRPINTCSIVRNATGFTLGGERTLYCSDTRPTNWTITYPPEMEGNYMVSTHFLTPFTFFVDVQTMCCDLPVDEHAIRLNATCSRLAVPSGEYNWTYTACEDDGVGITKVCRSPSCEDTSCIEINKYVPNSCQGGGGSFQRAFCMRATGNGASNLDQWPPISPTTCNDTVYTQRPGHEAPWVIKASGSKSLISGTATLALAVVLGFAAI